MATVEELLDQLAADRETVLVAKEALEAAILAKVATEVALGQAYSDAEE